MTHRVPIALAILLRCVKLCQGRVLLFVAVDTSQRTQELLKKNVAHVKQQGIDCDVALGLYQGHVRDLDKDWYEREVSHAVVGGGYKFHLMQKAHKDMRETKPWEENYEWIWALDSDIDLTQTDVMQLLALASVTKSPIVGPTYISRNISSRTNVVEAMTVTDHGRLMRKHHHRLSRKGHHQPRHSKRGPHSIQNPNANCDFRHTDFVELTAPMLRPTVLATLLDACPNCIQKRSDWGLDMMWCKYVSEKFDVQGCALIDRVPVVHLDWGLARITNDFKGAFDQVQASYAQYWSNHTAFSCELEEDAHTAVHIREQPHKEKRKKKSVSKVVQKFHPKKGAREFALHSHASHVFGRHRGRRRKNNFALHKDEHKDHKLEKSNRKVHLPGHTEAEDDFEEVLLKSKDTDSKVDAGLYPWKDPVIREGRLLSPDNSMEKIWIVTDKS